MNDRTFVSYSRNDSQFAVKLASDLRANGASVWLDQLDIAAGARWDSAIEEALRRSARVIVLLSPKAVASQNVLDEVSFALDEGKTIVPVLVESCTVPMRLRRLQYVDFTPGYDAALGRLLVTLGVARTSVAPTAQPAPEPPRAETPPPAAAPASAAEPVFASTRAQTDGGQRRVLLWLGGAGVAAAVIVAVILQGGGTPSDTTTNSSAPDVSASAPDATTESTASQSSARPATTQTPAVQTPTAPAPTAQEETAAPGRSVETAPLVRMAPRGGGFGSMVAPLRRADPLDDTDMPGFQALVRELDTRTSLSGVDLERLGDARFKACRFSTQETACSKQVDANVASLLEGVCKRQGSPNISACAMDYEFAILSRQQGKVREMLKQIKPG